MEEKLNKRERYKAQLKPIDYYKDFEDLDFENLGEGDRFYLQDFGIYNVDFLEDEFTIRIRVPGGRVECTWFEELANIVEEYNLVIILTARAGIQLHNISADDILSIHKRINNLGLSTWQSFGDNVRNIVTDVYDGCGKFSAIEVHPIVMKMNDYIVKNPTYVGMLPRRVSVGISGNSANVTSFFTNDLYFALAKKDGIFGFNVYMGGKNTEVAKDADIFLKEEEVFDFFKAFIEAFNKEGSRFSRSKTRIFHMIEEIGMDGMRVHVQGAYKNKIVNGGELIIEKAEFLEFHELKDERFAFCYQTDFARLDANEIRNIASYATKNSAQVRFGIDQNIYIIGLKDKTTTLNSPAISQTILACAGNLCPFAVWSIKDETAYLPLDKINKHRIQVGFSGCAKGCGRHRHTDIGLIGLKTNHFGDTDGGARIFLGAQHSSGESTSRQLFSMVPFVHLNRVISIVIELFELSGYKNFEEYSREILNRYSEEFLSLWVLSIFETDRTIVLPKQDKMESFEFETALLKKELDGLDFFDHIDSNFFNSVSYMSKKLWTIEGASPIYKPSIDRVNFR